MRKNLPSHDDFLGLTVDSDFHLEELIGKGCNALVFRGYSEALKHSAAYKVIPTENLAPGDAWKVEPQKANSLEHSSVVHCRGHEDWRERKGCVVLKYDYVKGVSLREFLRNRRDQVTVPFIRSFLRTMLELFYEMQRRGIVHGDLHSGNILVSKPSQFQRKAVEEFKVTDFGINDLTSGGKLFDDFGQLARILSDLINCIDYQNISAEEKYSFNILNDHFAAKHLIEKDRSRDPLARNPDKLLGRLEEIDDEYRSALSRADRNSLSTPFDYLSCEQIGQQHSLLHALYSNKFLGIAEIESVNNLVVTGPRGCGKSTVFRSLSLKHRLITSTEYDIPQRYLGIYYHCHDLHFKFPRYTLSNRRDAINLPLHYLTARLLIEILDVIQQLAHQNVNVASKEVKVCHLLWGRLSLKRPGLPSSDSFSVLISALTHECQWAVEKQRFADDSTQLIKRPLYGPDKFLEACAVLKQEIPILSDKPFFCFIDDYSIPHISEDLQRNLNRLLMHRNEFCFFKMATESPVSFAASDIDGKSYIEGREFEVLNLGLIYLRGDEARKLEFLDDVFAKRLKAVPDYPVASLTELIGDGENKSHNEIAEKIADGEKLEWWGRNTLNLMCSGDIHQLITLARKMVSDTGGPENLVANGIPKIPAKIQNKVIRTHAGDFLQNLADSGNNGERLRKIVTAFGNVAHSYIKFRQSKNEANNPRHQASRIELHEAPIFEGDTKEIYEDLLRYSVFIQDTRGKSLRGQLVPRLYLRRFLIPHFNLTFSLRDSILMEVDEFRGLLTDPSNFENRKKLKQVVLNNGEISSTVLQYNLDLPASE